MADPEKIITQLLSGFQFELIWLLVKAGIVFWFFLFFKDLLKTTLYYFQFKGNSYVSIGTLVEINKFIGRIKKIGLTYIVIEGEKGYYRVSMSNWQKQDWIFLRTQRRSKDELAGKRLGLRENDDIKIDRNSDEYKAIESYKINHTGNET